MPVIFEGMQNGVLPEVSLTNLWVSATPSKYAVQTSCSTLLPSQNFDSSPAVRKYPCDSAGEASKKINTKALISSYIFVGLMKPGCHLLKPT